MTKEAIPQGGDRARAKKHTGATSEILRGEQLKPFAEGQTSNVAQEKVVVVHNKKSREKDFVVKKLKQGNWYGHEIEAQMDAFQLLKSAGVKHIPTTYRQIGQSEILMTDYNQGDKVAVNAANENERASNLHIDSITNLSEVLLSIDEDIKRATAAGIPIISDCYFFIVPISGGDVQIDFAIADLGAVKTNRTYHLYSDNIGWAEYALLSFISSYIDDEHREEYKQYVEEWASSLVGSS